ERAGYQGGSSRQTQPIADKDYVRGVYFFLYDPNTTAARAIDESSIRLYLDEGNSLVNQTNIDRGRSFVDPNTATICADTVGCPADTTKSTRGVFRLLKSGSGQDYDILNDVYGPLYKVIRLRSALTSDDQTLAVTYRYRDVDASGTAIGDSLHVGG